MIIAMAIFDTLANQRHEYTVKTLESIATRVSLGRHRLFLVDNASDDPRTISLLTEWSGRATVIRNDANLGTAVAINKAWARRLPGEACCKMDNDVVVECDDWPDQIEAAFQREPKIGIVALKRNDLAEEPNAKDEHYRTRLVMLPHAPGQSWIVAEQIYGPAMGTCEAFRSDLLDKIGGLYQMQDEGNLYGWDDSDASHRAQLAGFGVVFLPHILIHHIDRGDMPYTKEKCDVARKWIDRFQEVRAEYTSGRRPLFWQDK